MSAMTKLKLDTIREAEGLVIVWLPTGARRGLYTQYLGYNRYCEPIMQVGVLDEVDPHKGKHSPPANGKSHTKKEITAAIEKGLTARWPVSHL